MVFPVKNAFIQPPISRAKSGSTESRTILEIRSLE
jgi:hypothetical protein